MKWARLSGEGTRSKFTTVHPSSMSAATTARPSLPLPPGHCHCSIHLCFLRFVASLGDRISGIGEPMAEIEDAHTDKVPIPFGGQVLRLACAELGRTRDECRAKSRALRKREIAVMSRCEHHLAWIQP